MSFGKFRLHLEATNELELEHPSLAFLKCPSRKSTISRPAPPSRSDVLSREEALRDDVATYLRTLTIQILDILSNSNGYSDTLLAKHITTDFEAHKDSAPGQGWGPLPSGLEMLRFNSRVLPRMPNMKAEVISSIAKVQENGRKAEVWTWMEMTGLPVSEAAVKYGGEMVEGDGICKESVCVLRWEKLGKEWMCVSGHVVRGVLGV